ncbi:MAG TPA: Mrp/NBP35 family ATP-binding protein [SAR86 cluster bacterium]|jgi:ATP-binding protein involved in chromosome partitioning|nr:Mrp/NBP35 family ATP-binding protein [SAR86 cluster bacterium]|tara:strand:+ start:3082 stop:3909 length:828 start_codon:yes stop_codon:yes gene_type:complete
MNQVVNNKLRIPETLRKVKNIVGIFSAKGGVGKSAIALQLAISLKDKGYKVGLVDADIYGPSQAVLLNSEPGELKITDNKIIEPLNKEGISFISMGLIANEKMPVIWRGPMVSGAVMQLLSQTNWGELDYLIIDTPPGTGDVQLTLLQKIPLTGTVIVTTPQNVSISDCRKGIEMIKKLSIPILGLIENMSWFQPNDSEKKYFLFGEDGGKDLAAEYKIDLLAQLPLIEKEGKKELHELDQIKTSFEILTGKIIELIKEIKSKKVDSIPQTNVTK